MQGVGVFVTIVGYALIYTAYEQGFGSGGSFLYWLTGNQKLGQPSKSTSSSGNNKPITSPNQSTPTKPHQTLSAGK